MTGVVVPAFSLRITIDDEGVHIGTEDGSLMSERRAQAIVEQFVGAPWRSMPIAPESVNGAQTPPPEFVDALAQRFERPE